MYINKQSLVTCNLFLCSGESYICECSGEFTEQETPTSPCITVINIIEDCHLPDDVTPGEHVVERCQNGGRCVFVNETVDLEPVWLNETDMWFIGQNVTVEVTCECAEGWLGEECDICKLSCRNICLLFAGSCLNVFICSRPMYSRWRLQWEWSLHQRRHFRLSLVRLQSGVHRHQL